MDQAKPPHPPLSPSSLGGGLAGFLAAALVLAVRGEIGYLLYPPTLVALLAWGVVVGLAGRLLDRGSGDRARTDLARIRAVWVPALAGVGALSAGLLAVLALPGALGLEDPWARGFGLAPEEVAPLVLAAFAMHAGLAAWLAARAIAALFAHGLEGRGPVRDAWGPRVGLGLGLTAVLLLGAIAFAPSGRLAHLRAWAKLKAGDPDASLAQLEALLAADPDDRLADSALYRMARLWQDELAAPRAAAAAFEKLLARYPDSPWADDALLHLAEVRLAESDPDRALALAVALPGRFPGSSRIGAAGLLVARIHRQAGRTAEAARVLEGLLGASGAVRRAARYPFILVSVATLAREELAQVQAATAP